MTDYRAEPYLRDLTDFQRRSVDHVFEQFYGPAGANRFLVADETGLGKTRVARGLIARAIEHLQHDATVDRIDVVYVCSNADLAQQNIKRLNVTGGAAIPFASRLTLLGEHSRRLADHHAHRTPVNLVSFTPGTSFEMGYSLGLARERAMILLALTELMEFDGWELRAVHRLLQGQVSTLERFVREVNDLRRVLDDEGIDTSILRDFDRRISHGGPSSAKCRFRALVTDMGRKQSIPAALWDEMYNLVRGLRGHLAAASVHTLEPDLIILDEFQRFRGLLDQNTTAGDLAHHLFEYDAAKVLLLSATPYKPFTYAEEREEDHEADLFNTLGFIAAGRSDLDLTDIRATLRRYREELVTAPLSEAAAVVPMLRKQLLKLMSRAERPVLPDGRMSVERVTPADDIRPEDLRGYVHLSTVGTLVAQDRDRGLFTPEYWKSAPYFANFCDGYQLGKRLDTAPASPQLTRALTGTQRIDPDGIEGFVELDPGNARARTLAAHTVGRGWWQLLWVPPSLPYLQPEGAYASPDAQNMTKRMVFSSWSATPTAVASVLSYEAERRAAQGTNYERYTPADRKRLTTHLQFRLAAGRPASMTTLLIFWPMGGLARDVDPVRMVANFDGEPLPVEQARAVGHERVAAVLNPGGTHVENTLPEGTAEQEMIWRAAFALESSWPADDLDDYDLADAIAPSAKAARVVVDDDDDQERDDLGGLGRHIQQARLALGGQRPASSTSIEALAEVALFSPANIAYRALGRIAEDEHVSEVGLFRAAGALANGLRSLFNRPDATKTVEELGNAELPYWANVLNYCADGNLEAVLDEYLHHLAADGIDQPITDAGLLDLATSCAAALTLRTSTYRSKDPMGRGAGPSFVPRFALRYGGRQQVGEDLRQPEVRHSFNSPFWPIVLISTSVGQEGIDLHWWCHAVFHWNTPANPVDFEQREGRVDRYRGHAVRKNVARAHGTCALASYDGGNPWDALYAAATDYRAEYGEFTPGWVYPGDAKIERHVAPFLMSSDAGKYERLKRDVTLYRLTFGQPRQEDLLELLRKRGLDADPEQLAALRINLMP